MNSKLYSNFPYETFTVGFDKFFDEMRKPAENKYPPYNIIKSGEDSYFIEMAVAGFTENDIEVTLEGNVLKIVGSHTQDEMDYDYIHRGIATRAFEKSFTLAENVEIKYVSLGDGILGISLIRQIPEEKKPKKIEINTGKKFLQE